MNRDLAFQSKAETYARYRWSYAPQAITTILEHTQLSCDAVVADVGAGTGIFTQQLVTRFDTVFAIEPNEAMRHFAEQSLDCQVLAGHGEATTLPDHSVDLITVAQALHWCEPEPTRQEFARILKPNGWLAILKNVGVDTVVGRAIGSLYSAEYGFKSNYRTLRPEQKPLSFYYGHDNFLSLSFPFESKATLDEFIGAQLSAAHSPDEDDPLYPKFIAAAEAIFEQFQVDGHMTTAGQTLFQLGQPAWHQRS